MNTKETLKAVQQEHKDRLRNIITFQGSFIILPFYHFIILSKHGGQTGQHCRPASVADVVETARQI